MIHGECSIELAFLLLEQERMLYLLASKVKRFSNAHLASMIIIKKCLRDYSEEAPST
jgi:hypothetical protein